MSAMPQMPKLNTSMPMRIMPNSRPAPLRKVSSATLASLPFAICQSRAGAQCLDLLARLWQMANGRLASVALDTLRKGAGRLFGMILMGMLVFSFGIWGIADIFRGYG